MIFTVLGAVGVWRGNLPEAVHMYARDIGIFRPHEKIQGAFRNATPTRVKCGYETFGLDRQRLTAAMRQI